MKKILPGIFFLAIIALLPSCKKCSTCTHKCFSCTTPSAGLYTYCNGRLQSDAEFMNNIADKETKEGYICTRADETEQICKKGFLAGSFLAEEVGWKEDDGWDCDFR